MATVIFEKSDARSKSVVVSVPSYESDPVIKLTHEDGGTIKIVLTDEEAVRISQDLKNQVRSF